jgi:hypothetical protein
MKMTVFWDVALCNLVDVDRRFRELTTPIIMLTVSIRLHSATSQKAAIFKQGFIVPRKHVFKRLEKNVERKLGYGNFAMKVSY